MRHLPVDALLLFSVSSASAILPELQDRIRGLVGKVDLLVDLVDHHSGLVVGGPGDLDVKTGMGTCRGTGGSGVGRKQGGSMAQDRKYGPQTSRWSALQSWKNIIVTHLCLLQASLIRHPRPRSVSLPQPPRPQLRTKIRFSPKLLTSNKFVFNRGTQEKFQIS